MYKDTQLTFFDTGMFPLSTTDLHLLIFYPVTLLISPINSNRFSVDTIRSST